MKPRLAQLTIRPSRVEVEWIDSDLDAGWKEADVLLNSLDGGPCSCWTCGYLVDEREESITVVGSYHVDPKTGVHREYNSALTIPRAAIVQIKELRR